MAWLVGFLHGGVRLLVVLLVACLLGGCRSSSAPAPDAKGVASGVASAGVPDASARVRGRARRAPATPSSASSPPIPPEKLTLPRKIDKRVASRQMDRTPENLREEHAWTIRWNPPVRLERAPGEDTGALALRVLSAPAVLEALELRAGIDGFEVTHATSDVVQLGQRLRFEGRDLRVLHRWFEVRLENGAELNEIRSSYRANIELPARKLLTEARARRIAIEASPSPGPGLPAFEKDAPPGELCVLDGRFVYYFARAGRCRLAYVNALTGQVAFYSTCPT